MTCRNLSGSSNWAVCDELGNLIHVTFGILSKKGRMTLFCASSYCPFVRRVGTSMRCARSMIVQSLIVPMTRNSLGPFLRQDH